MISVFGVGGRSTSKAHKKTLGVMELCYNLTVVVVVVYIAGTGDIHPSNGTLVKECISHL